MVSAPSGSSSSTNGTEWLTPWRFAALLAVLLFAMFPDVLLGQRCFFYRDFQLFAYPWATHHREAFWRGELPLWNPLSNCGLPFLAQWNTLTLYPLSLFYLIFPLGWSLSVFCIGHLLLGGVGMYLLARRWTGDSWAAALAGMAFAFGGLTLNSLTWTNNIAALGWMPWVVRLAEAAWETERRNVVAAALAGAMQMLSGAPEIIFLTWGFIGVLALHAALKRGASRGRIAARLALLMALVGGLCAVQLLPFLELLVHSHRDRHFGAALWPLPVWGPANFFVPLFFSFPWSQGVFFQYDQYWTSSYYVGIGTVTLALTAFGRWRQPRVWLLGWVLVASLVLAMGDAAWIYSGLKHVFPFLGVMRYPIKFIVLAVFVLPLLAALAATALARATPPRAPVWRRGIFGVAVAVLALIGGILWFARHHPMYPPPYDQWSATWQSGLTRALFLAGFVGGLLGLPHVQRPRARGLLRVGLLVWVWLDAYTHAPRQNPTLQPWIYEPVAGLHTWSAAPVPGRTRAMPSLAAELELHTVPLDDPAQDFVRKRAGLYSNCNLVDRLPKVNGVFSLHLCEAEQVNQLLYGNTNRSLPPLMDFLGVSQATAPGRIMDWLARTNPMPLLSSGQTPVFTADCRHALQRDDFDPRRVVYLPPEAKTTVQATNATRATIVNERVTAHRIECEIGAESPALIVIAQTYYHPWKAYVDGCATRVWRANHAFQAVEVPAGQHHLKLVYQDRALWIGGVISGLALVGCAVLGRARPRHSDAGKPAETLVS